MSTSTHKSRRRLLDDRYVRLRFYSDGTAEIFNYGADQLATSLTVRDFLEAAVGKGGDAQETLDRLLDVTMAEWLEVIFEDPTGDHIPAEPLTPEQARETAKRLGERIDSELGPLFRPEEG